MTVLVDFESSPPQALRGFGGAEDSTVVVDPTDATNQVAQVVKSATAELWAGTTVYYCPNESIAPLPFSATEQRMSLRVWSPDAGIPVRMKVEDAGNPAVSVETEASTTVASQWETLIFDFGNEAVGTAPIDLAATYNKVSVFFNFGTTGAMAGEKTYFMDDITFLDVVFSPDCPGGGGGDELIDFETADTGAGFTWAVFENDDNPPLEILANPDNSGINASATVGRITARVAPGQPWAGTETAHGDIGPITLDSSNSIVKVMVYKSVISDVGVKFAIPSGGAQAEVRVPNTVVDQWEELTFDLSAHIGLPESTGIDQFIFFPDFDNAGRTGDNVVYFDNVRLTDGT